MCYCFYCPNDLKGSKHTSALTLRLNFVYPLEIKEQNNKPLKCNRKYLLTKNSASFVLKINHADKLVKCA